MAIKLNKRKRKHEDTEEQQSGLNNVDDGEEAVPKKIAKESKSPKNVEKESQKQQVVMDTDPESKSDAVDPNESTSTESKKKKKKKHQEDNNDKDTESSLVLADNAEEEAETSPDSGIEHGAEKEMKFSKDFKMLDFRAKLRGTNFITELRHFLHVYTVRPKIVAKYIEKRGKPLELAEALERIDKTNVLHVGYICEALQLVVMEILTNQKQLMESAVYGCRYFLKVHGSVVEQLLSSAQLNHRRIALKLLTAIVCVEPQLGRQVLNSYDIMSNVRKAEQMLSHSSADMGTTESVRKCFIHFVLAFLVDGNNLLIRNILDRGHLIQVLATGLLYDDHVTVCVVLNTLRKYVLERTDISKTKKLHVFDSRTCKKLVLLYSWRGPNGLPNFFKNKRISDEKAMSLNNAEDQKLVTEAVHEFLMLLLTSRKYGVAFDSMTHYRQKHNVLQGKTVGSLFRPYSDEKKAELVIKTLQTCPELVRHTVRNFAGIVNPIFKKGEVVQAMNFLGKLILAVPPELLGGAIDKMTATDFAYWIKEACLPVESIMLIISSNSLQNPDFAIRVATNRLLLAMMTQYSNYVAALEKREKAKNAQSSLRRFKFDILNHLLINFPTIEAILYSLFLSIRDQNSEGVDVLEHLSITLDLVLIMCQENRAFVHQTSKILDYLDVLRPLYESSFSKDSDVDKPVSDANFGNIKLEFKAIKTMLTLFPRALSPSQKLFEKVVRSFTKAYLYADAELQLEAGALLQSIFKNTDIFDTCSYEINLWLEPLRYFDYDVVQDVTTIMVQIFRNSDASVELPPLSAANDVSNRESLQRLFTHIEQGLSVQAYVETIAISKFLPLIFKGVELVEPYVKYIELVCLLMYHYFPTPAFVEQVYDTHLSALSPYFKSWLSHSTDEKTQHTRQLINNDIVARIPLLQRLQQSVLEGKQEFVVTFAKASVDDYFEVEVDGNLLQLHTALKNHHLIMIFVQQITFVVTQLLEISQLNANQAHVAADYLIKLLKITAQLATTKPSVNTEEQTELDRILHYIYNIRLNYVRATELFSAADKAQLNYLCFLRELTDYCKDLPNFDQYAANYRSKIIKSVAISLTDVEETNEATDQLAECVKLVEAFNLTTENCIELLTKMTNKLNASDLLLNGKRKIFFDLLICTLQRLTVLQQPIECLEELKQVGKYYIKFHKDLAEGIEPHLEQLEVVLYDFLINYPQHISLFGSKFFKCFFVERKLSKPMIKLARLLLDRNVEELSESFVKLLPDNIDKKELIYPLLSVAFKKKIELEPQLLQTIYQSFKNGFMKSIEKPQKAAVIYKENATCSVALIQHCLPKSECIDFCKKTLKIEAVELYQMPLVQAIYKQALAASKEAGNTQQSGTIFVNFINLLVQMLNVELKKQLISMEKLENIAWYCNDWWSSVDDELLGVADFSKLWNSQHWLNYCKISLKLGMQQSEEEIALSEQLDQRNGLLLKLLAFLCEKMNANYNPETDEANQTAVHLFEMICTHSRFLDILLTTTVRPTMVKTSVLQLLYTLACKAPQTLQTNQIPIILGAYQARLTHADQYALALLSLYERFDVGLQHYRPFIWGESAVAFYSLRATDDERAKLQQQETSIMQVMSLIDKQVCLYTIDNFPIWRKLDPCEQLPTLSFTQPNQVHVFGANPLEQRIELGHTEFSKQEIRLCPKREGIYERCYDPAFFVPLMMVCFAPETHAHAARPVQNGLLSMVFTALASQDKDMRLAAACSQQRYRAQFEQSKFYEKPLWVQMYDNIQAGLSDLRNSWMRHKQNSGTPRVPLIPTLFIAKALNVTTDPTHLLYKQLTMYLRLKSSFDFQTIPEFNVLFFSPEVEHQEYRQFIIEVIRDGIKCSADLFQLVTTNTFKVLMGFYGSTMSTLDTNLLILSIFSTCVKIPGTAEIMVDSLGILPWLAGIITNTEFFHFDIIEGLITILNNFWYALKASQTKFHNYGYLQLHMQRLLLQLLPLLSPRISIANFAKYLNLLNKTASGQHLAINALQLDQLLDCAAKHFPTQIVPIKGISKFGGSGAETHEDYCKRVLELEPDIDTSAVLAMSSLRAYVIDWWQARRRTETI